MSEKIEFRTKDGITIVGDFYAASGSPAAQNRAAILLHMMPATRESWRTFGEYSAETGIVALAIDLRGHGESKAGPSGKILDYRAFSNSEHQASIEDVRAAAEYLKARGLAPAFVIGASIGANLALQFLAESGEIRSAALLSPGTDYRGIGAIPLAQGILPDQKVLIVAAKDDRNVDGATEMAEEIYEALSCGRRLKIFETGGHGTDMLDAHPEFMEELVNFFKE